MDCAPETIRNAKFFVRPKRAMELLGGKLCILLHWLLAAEPKDRPTAHEIVCLLEGLPTLYAQDILQQLPVRVRECLRTTIAAAEKQVIMDGVSEDGTEQEKGLVMENYHRMSREELEKILP